ncbi:MAG: ATPase inhibitor subunit zeta [Bacteroidales bacterium]
MLFDRTKAKAAATTAPDLESQARLHRDRMAGLWAAELLGLIGHAAQDYARELAHPEDAELPGDEERVVHRLSRDLRGKVSAHEIRAKLTHLLHEARRQLGGERRRS